MKAAGGDRCAVFNYEAASDQFTADPQKPLRLWARVPYGREGEGLNLLPVPEALNRACPDSKKDVLVRGLIFDVDTGLLREVQPIAQQAAA